MQGELEQARRAKAEIEDRYHKKKEELEIIETQLIEKDELAKGFEEENLLYQE